MIAVIVVIIIGALSKSFIMKGSQGSGVSRREGESQESCQAGVGNHEGRESGTMEPWKHILVWRPLLHHAKRYVNLHDVWTQTTSLKLEHISQCNCLQRGGANLYPTKI